MLSGMMPTNVMAEQMAGMGMSRMAAIGGPMLTGLSGMAGLDPMSLGLKAGMGAYSSGMVGLAGAAGIGMGVAGGVGMLGLGAQYAAGQMSQGAQQQMQLNQGLRQNYNFLNSQGGMGFTSNQGFQIGSMVRSMSNETGPGGEHHSFGELSRIAQNLGRMGMAQNVRTVEEFRSKFKESVETLKKISHELGTTLEDAMKTMASMKGSGIFKAADQANMAGMMRSTAMAGGMAMSEVSGMASIGSQISRAVGGLGKSGAMAGMRTIGQIGSAQAVGAISEEDVYNATGLTGAEGRQALGAAQLQQSASFLRTSKGRYFLASVAGKNGQLNDESVAEWMSGGNMSTGRTAEMAHQNLAGVGRANFIRNEGRLRGEALSKFGGLTQSMALQQWLGSRGYDPNNMDDRAMLGFQRFTGMGRDEADVAIKQIQHMPEILMNMRNTERGLGVSDAMQRQRATTGVEGFQRKIEHTKEHVNNALQQAGARVLKAGSDQLESWFNTMSDIYVKSTTEGLDTIVTQMERSGSGKSNSDAMRRMFGSRASAGSAAARHVRSSAADLNNAAAGSALRAAREGFGGEGSIKLGASNADMIKLASIGASGDINGHMAADEALKSFESGLSGDVLAQFRAAGNAKTGGSRERQFGLMQNLQMGAGVVGDAQIASQLANRKLQYGGATGGYRSEAEAQEAQAALFMGRRARTDAVREAEAGFGQSALAGVLTAGSLAITGARNLTRDKKDRVTMQDVAMRNQGRASRLLDRFNGNAEYNEGLASVFNDSTTLGMAADLYTGDESQQKAARSAMYDEVQKIRKGKDHLDKRDQARVDAMTSMAMASDPAYRQLMEDMNSGKATAEGQTKVLEAMRRVTGRKDLSIDEARKLSLAGLRGGQHAVDERQQANLEKLIQKRRASSEEEKTRLQAGGMAKLGADGKLVVTGRGDADALSADISKDLTAMLNADPSDVFGANDRSTALHDKIAGKSMAERQKIARMFAGTTAGDNAALSISAEKRFAGAKGKYGSNAGAVEALFGFDVDKDEQKALGKMSADDQAKYLAQKIGLGEGGAEQLKGILGEKNQGLASSRLEDLKGGLTGKAKEQLKEREEGKRDPNVVQLEKIRENSDKQTNYLKAMASLAAGSDQKLQAMLDKKDPEQK